MKKSYCRNHTKETSHDYRLCCLRKATGQHVKHRCGKSFMHQCRKSSNHRRIVEVTPDQKQNLGQDEEDLIVRLHALLGNRWSLIAGRLPGRTEDELRKYWNSHLEGKLISTGIDPNNHDVNQVLCRPSFSSSSSCSLNIILCRDDDDDETTAQYEPKGNVSHEPKH